jgi:hypothetical protein
MTEPVFLIGLAIVGTTIGMVVKTIANAIWPPGSRSDTARFAEQLDRQAAALEDAQNSLENQAAQLAELQERVDFAERMLAQGRDRPGLKPGDQAE